MSYVVTETLAGRGSRLKERTVARYALGRDGSFSGATDSAARVQATRVRAALERYYAGSGAADTLLIALAPGSYVPTFTSRASVAQTTSRLGAGIAVVELDDLRRDNAGDRSARTLSDAIVRALSSFPHLRAVGSITSDEGAARLTDPRTLARSFDVEYVLTGDVMASGDVLRLAVRVHDGGSGGVVWSQAYDVEVGPRPGFADEDDLVRRVAATVGDVRGVVARDLERHSARGIDPLPHPAALAFYRFAESGTQSDAEAADRELGVALEAHPDETVLLAMAGWTCCYLAIMGWADDERGSIVRAETLAARALVLDPLSAHAHQVLAGVALHRGSPTQCRHHVLRTVELSPVNASLLYTSGVLLIQVGDWDDGIALIRESNRLNPYHPGFQHVFLGLERLLASDDAGALAEASLLRHPDDQWGPLLRFLALAGQGFEVSAGHELDATLAVVPQLLDHDCAYLTEELRDAPMHVRVELRRRVRRWMETHPA